MRKVGTLAALFVLLLAGSAYAFELSVDNPTQSVLQGDTASYVFTIISPDDSVYTLSTSPDRQGWVTMPNDVRIDGENRFTVYITAPRDASAQTHIVPIIVSSKRGQMTYEIPLVVKTKAGITIDALAPAYESFRSDEIVAIDYKVTSNEPVQRDVELYFTITDPYGKEIRNDRHVLSMDADSAMEGQYFFEEERLVAGRYSVKATAKVGAKTWDVEETTFDVSALSNILKDKRTSFTFFAIKSVISVENVGNTPTEVQVRDSVPLFWSFFTKPDSVAAKSSDGSEVLYTWNLAAVDPNTTQNVGYQIILWPVYMIVLVAGFFLFKGYTTYLTPSVSKELTSRVSLGEGKEGSIIIHAKNKGLRTLHNVVVDDVIPPSFKITDASLPRPKYRKTSRGSELRWSLGTLSPGEERVFSYKVKNLLGIVGTVELPRVSMISEGRTWRSGRLKTVGDKRHKPV